MIKSFRRKLESLKFGKISKIFEYSFISNLNFIIIIILFYTNLIIYRYDI